jgi:hypothetical protein
MHTGVAQTDLSRLPVAEDAKEPVVQCAQWAAAEDAQLSVVSVLWPQDSIGQGVPFKHCQDAREGSVITSSASTRNQLHTLRLSVRINLIKTNPGDTLPLGG